MWLPTSVTGVFALYGLERGRQFDRSLVGRGGRAFRDGVAVGADLDQVALYEAARKARARKVREKIALD